MRYLGAHVSVAGGLINGVKTATALGINTAQIHPTAPQRWNSTPIDQAGIESMIKEQKKSPLKLLFTHAIYLINLAQPDKQKFHLGKMSLVHYLNFLHDVKTIARHYESDLNTGGVVVHVGSAIHYPNKQEALERVSYGINWILENSNNDELLLLESSAGSGQVIGEKLEDLAWLREKTEQKERVGIALDTEHMFASGYDWTKPEEVITQVKQVIPLELVKLIHLNDSKVACGSKKDRHENLGEGFIGEAAFKYIVPHPDLAGIPMVLETPNMKSVEDAAIDVKKLTDWAKL
jgi:apurinic endonuclease APN1